MKRVKVKLTPYQAALIDYKLRQAKAKRLGIKIDQLPMLDEIKEVIRNHKSKK